MYIFFIKICSNATIENMILKIIQWCIQKNIIVLKY
jgi:hypothetical protein